MGFFWGPSGLSVFAVTGVATAAHHHQRSLIPVSCEPETTMQAAQLLHNCLLPRSPSPSIAFSLSKRSRYASEGFQSSGFRAGYVQSGSNFQLVITSHNRLIAKLQVPVGWSATRKLLLGTALAGGGNIAIVQGSGGLNRDFLTGALPCRLS